MQLSINTVDSYKDSNIEIMLQNTNKEERQRVLYKNQGSEFFSF